MTTDNDDNDWVEYPTIPPAGRYLWRIDEEDNEPVELHVACGMTWLPNGLRQITYGGQWKRIHE